MSSETSTEARPLAGPPSTPISTRDPGIQVWQLFTLAGLITASIVAFSARTQPPSVRIALILTTFGAAAIGVAALRTFAPLTGKAGPVAPAVVGGRTRAALERDKALVLRSLKELEFDRAMGKISDKDFAEMSARLRARAARILKQLDAGSGYRQAIEQEVSRRVATASAAGGGETRATAGAASTGSPPDEGIEDGQQEPIVRPSTATCAACGTSNDADARFCKECGVRLPAAEA